MGFLKDELSDIKYALGYDPNNLPSGSETLLAKVGFFASANIYYRNRYFADISYRTSGSSAYGSENRFAPMWSFGLGWNLHKEKFPDNSFAFFSFQFECIDIQINFFSGMENNYFPFSLIAFKPMADNWSFLCMEINNPLPKFRIEFRIMPGHILIFGPKSCNSSFHAGFKWHIKEEYCITFFKSTWNTALIISVNNPFVSFHDFL